MLIAPSLPQRVQFVNNNVRPLLSGCGTLNSFLLFYKDGQEKGVPLSVDFADSSFTSANERSFGDLADTCGFTPAGLLATIAKGEVRGKARELGGEAWLEIVLRNILPRRPDAYVIATVVPAKQSRYCVVGPAERMSLFDGCGVSDEPDTEVLLILGHCPIRSFAIVTPVRKGPGGVVFGEPKVVDSLRGDPLFGGALQNRFLPSVC